MYIAKKPCTFAGQDFLIGDPVPEELVLKSRVPHLIKERVIEEVEVEAQEGIVKFSIPVQTENGGFMVDLSNEEMVQVFEVMQGTAEAAVQLIEAITSNDALILLDAADSRKAVKKLVKERASVLMAETVEE